MSQFSHQYTVSLLIPRLQHTSLWLALLACWPDSPNAMSFHKPRHCIIRRMSPWHFVSNHTYTLWRDPPLAEPGKIDVHFFSPCFPNRESERLVQCYSVTSGTASCTIYLSCVIWHTFPDEIFCTSRHCFVIIVITSLKYQSQQCHQQNDHYVFHNRRNLDLYHYILT
jgi:hypothetical protein